MSGLLLDTNVFAMVLTGDARLPDAVLERIGAADRVAISAISFYEIGQKVRLGKWPEVQPFAPGLVERAWADGFDLLALSPAASLEAALLDWDHRDPFDRMIAVVARREDLPLVSSDAVFDAMNIPRIWG